MIFAGITGAAVAMRPQSAASSFGHEGKRDISLRTAQPH